MQRFQLRKTLNWTFSTLGCPHNTLEEVIALANSFGLTSVELRGLNGRLNLPAIFADQFQSPADLKSYFDTAGIKVASLDSSLRLIGNTQNDRQEFLHFIPWAEGLGGVPIRVFDGGTFTPHNSSTQIDEALETVNWWQEEKKKNGWKSTIIVETHDSLFTSESILNFVQAVDAPHCILWDTHHTWKRAGEDPLETWEKIGAHVKHIHVKDSVSEPSQSHPYQYRFLGEGEFPLEKLLKRLERDEFSGPVSIEWERKWHPYLEPLDVALEKAQNAGLW